jgi:hypothetical protein
VSSSRTHKVSIDSHRVVVDGVDLSPGLTGINLTMGVDEIPRLTLDVQLIAVTEVTDIESKVTIRPAAHDALVALGWTPPSDTA